MYCYWVNGTPTTSECQEINFVPSRFVFARMMLMKVETENTFGIVPVYKNIDGDYLFCVIKHAAGHWSFPKGHKDGDETDEETARRETFEETGLNDIKIIPDIRLTETYSFVADNVHHDKMVTYFLGKTNSLKVSISARFRNEIGDIKWLPYYELVKQITFPESRKVAEEANKYLRNNK